MPSSDENMFADVKAISPAFEIGTDPSTTYSAWIKDVNIKGAKIASEIYTGGLRSTGILLTDAQFRAQHPDVPDANGVPQPVPRPVPPVRPALPDANAGAAPSNNYDRVHRIFKVHDAAENRMFELVLASFTQTMRDETEDMVNNTGHLDRSLTWLITHVVTKYGSATINSIETSMEALAKPILNECDFEAGTNVYAGHFAKLVNNAQGLSQYAQMKIVDDMCATLPNVSSAILRYKQSNTDIGNRTFTAMRAFVLTQKEFFTVDTGGYIGSTTNKQQSTADRDAALIARGVALYYLNIVV
jgi:hypothetical protein